MWRERQDFEKASQRKGENAASRQNGHLINHYIPETIKFDFKVVFLRRFKYLQDNCSTKNYHTDLFLLLKNVHAMSGRNNIHPPSCLLYVLFYEKKDCPFKGDSEATINSLSS